MSSEKRKILKFSEVIALNDYLKTIITSEMVDGELVATYKDGMDDRTATKAMRKTIPSISVYSVMNLRQQAFGKLKRALTYNTNASKMTHARVDKLERRLDALVKWAGNIDPGTIFE
jgi:hypothetical protein